MLNLVYRHLESNEAFRIGDIDRTEETRIGYRVEDGQLIRMDVMWDSSPWRTEGDVHSIPSMVRGLEEVFENEGIVIGAFDGARLAGVAALQPRLTETMSQLVLLHVSNGYRRQGIASQFLVEIEALARESGAEALYVSATPSESAVGFYTSKGFEMTPKPHPELLELEPEDIHMIKPL